MQTKNKSILPRIFRFALIILLIILLMAIGFLVYMHTNAGKAFAKQRLEKYLQEKLDSRVSIGRLETNWSSFVTLHDIVLDDRRQQEMLRIGEMKMEYSVRSYLSGDLDVRSLSVHNGSVNVYREQGNPFYNFIYAVAAFSDIESSRTREWPGEQGFAVNISQFKIAIKDDYAGASSSWSVASLKFLLRTFNRTTHQYAFKYICSDSLQVVRNFSGLHPELQINQQAFPFLAIDSIYLANTSVKNRNTSFGGHSLIDIKEFTGSSISIDTGNVMLTAGKIGIHQYQANYKTDSSTLLSSTINPLQRFSLKMDTLLLNVDNSIDSKMLPIGEPSTNYVCNIKAGTFMYNGSWQNADSVELLLWPLTIHVATK